jgi:hypothetical protein
MLAKGSGSIINMASVARQVKGHRQPLRLRRQQGRRHRPDQIRRGRLRHPGCPLQRHLPGHRAVALAATTASPPTRRPPADAGAGEAAFIARQPMGRLGRPDEIAMPWRCTSPATTACSSPARRWSSTAARCSLAPTTLERGNSNETRSLRRPRRGEARRARRRRQPARPVGHRARHQRATCRPRAWPRSPAPSPRTTAARAQQPAHRPVHRPPAELRVHRPELCRPRRRDRRHAPHRADHLPEVARRLPGPYDPWCCPRARSRATGKWNSASSSAARPSTCPRPTR